MDEDLDDEFSGKVLNGDAHVYGGGIWNLGDAIWERAQLKIGNGRVSAKWEWRRRLSFMSGK